MKKDQDPCGCVPRSESRELVLRSQVLPPLLVTEPDDDPTGEWPVLKPVEPPQPPQGWDAIT